MKLSRETEYHLMGLVHLAQQPEGTVMHPAAIVEARWLPPSLLAETFRKLTRYGLVRPLRGATRRYILSGSTNEVTLSDVLEAIEGPGLLNGASSEITAALRRIPASLRGMETDHPQANGVDGGNTAQDIGRRTATPRIQKRVC
jgi:DNA-binding IscR family transcriptional regulator